MAKYKVKADYIALNKSRQKTEKGEIHERDIMTINPMEDLFTPGQDIVFSDSNFKFSVRTDLNEAKKHSRDAWISSPSSSVTWTLNDVDSSPISTETEIRLKPDYTSIKDFAHYGSSFELIKGTVNDVIMNFPAELYFSDKKFGEMFPNEINDRFADYYVISNQFGIDIDTDYIDESKVDNPYRYLCLYDKSYDYYEDGIFMGNGITRGSFVPEENINGCQGLIGTIKLSAKRNNPDTGDTHEISVRPDYLTINSAATETTLSVRTSPEDGWTVSNVPNWISMTTGGTGDTIVTLSIEENSETVERTCALTFKNTVSNKTATCHIVQVGREEIEFQVSPTEFSIPYLGANKKIYIIADSTHQWEIVNSSDIPDWLIVPDDKLSGYGSAEINIEIIESTSSSERTFDLNFKDLMSNESYTVNILQAAIPEEPIWVMPSTLEFTADQSTKYLYVTLPSNHEWTVSNIPNWISMVTGGTGNKNIEVTVDSNYETGEDRECELLFTDVVTTKTYTVSVVQEGGIIFNVEPQNVQVGADNGLTELIITNPLYHRWKIISYSPWISPTSQEGVGEGVLTIGFYENESTSDRNGTIVFEDTVTQKTYNVSFTQSGYIFNVNPSEITGITSEGGTVQVSLNITNNHSWSIISMPILNWVTSDTITGVGNTTLTITVSENSMDVLRRGTIVFKDNIRNKTITLSVEQEGGELSPMSISPTYMEVGADQPSTPYEITITNSSNHAWEVSTNETWIQPVTTAGTGSGTLKVGINDNPNNTTRTGNLIIEDKVTSEQHTVVFVQDAYIFNVDPHNVAFGPDEGSVRLTLNNPLQHTWEVTDKPTNWADILPHTGRTESEITLQWTNCDSENGRTGTVVITDTVRQKDVSIFLDQEGYTFDVYIEGTGEKEAEVEMMGGYVYVAFDNPLHHEWEVVSISEEWILAAQTDGTSDSLMLTILANGRITDLTLPRTGTITFRDKERPDKYYDIKIKQKGKSSVRKAIRQSLLSGEEVSVPIYVYLLNGQKYLLYSNNRPDFAKMSFRPCKEIINEYFNSIDDFELVLLNRDSNPKYKSIFETPYETDYGNKYTMESYIWPSENEWNPIISGPQYEAYINRLIDLSNYHDEYDTNILWRMLTHEAIKNLDWSFFRTNIDGDISETEEVDNIDTSKVEPIIQLYGRQFDGLKRYIDAIKYINNVTYNGKNNAPDYVLTDMVEIGGFNVKLPIPTGKTDVITSDTLFSARTEGYSEVDCNVGFVRNLKINEHYLTSIKGTRKGVESILGLLGLREDEYEIHEKLAIAEGNGEGYCSFSDEIVGDIGYERPCNVEGITYPYAKDVIGLNISKDTFKEGDDLFSGIGVKAMPCYKDMLDDSIKHPTYFAVPWYKNGKNYDGGWYFQSKGGWGKTDTKAIDNPELTDVTSITNDNFIYDESETYLKSAANIDELLSFTYSDVEDGTICYITDIGGIEGRYTEIDELTEDANAGSGYSHYFVLINKKNLMTFGKISDESIPDEKRYGWKYISKVELREGETENAQKVIYLESIKESTEGNNPHFGGGFYDDGQEYIDYMGNIFKYTLEESGFTYLSQEDIDAAANYTFNILSDITDDRKSDYFFNPLLNENPNINVDYHMVEVDTDGNVNEMEKSVEGEFSGYTPYNYEEGETNEEPSANSIINLKNVEIIFKVPFEIVEDGYEEEWKNYVTNVVMEYVKQVLPSTTIFNWKFEEE